MKTELETLEHDIAIINMAVNSIEDEERRTVFKDALSMAKSRLATLTAPKIRDGVLGRSYRGDGVFLGIRAYKADEQWGGTFHPLTIEELLPTLAQWVPGAVRWEYIDHTEISIMDGERNDLLYLPAPPRDDWETCKGEL